MALVRVFGKRTGPDAFAGPNSTKETRPLVSQQKILSMIYHYGFAGALGGEEEAFVQTCCSLGMVVPRHQTQCG